VHFQAGSASRYKWISPGRRYPDLGAKVEHIWLSKMCRRHPLHSTPFVRTSATNYLSGQVDFECSMKALTESLTGEYTASELEPEGICSGKHPIACPSQRRLTSLK
jgi:hypothetical protein